jgi:hypothetical protein
MVYSPQLLEELSNLNGDVQAYLNAENGKAFKLVKSPLHIKAKFQLFY